MNGVNPPEILGVDDGDGGFISRGSRFLYNNAFNKKKKSCVSSDISGDVHKLLLEAPTHTNDMTTYKILHPDKSLKCPLHTESHIKMASSQ